MLNRLRNFWRYTRRAWSLAGPYWSSEERWQARLLLGACVARTLAIVS